jgi:hypothetical protein
VHKETKNFRIWKGIDIDQKGKITIGKNDEIYEIRIYPLKDDDDKIKVLAKYNKKRKKITYVISTNRINTKPKTATIQEYKDLMKDFEKFMEKRIIIDKQNFLTKTQIYKEIE